MIVKCPGCKRPLAATDEMAGQQARCPHCKTLMKIPQIEPPLARFVDTRKEDFDFGSSSRRDAPEESHDEPDVIVDFLRQHVLWPIITAAVSLLLLVSTLAQGKGGGEAVQVFLGVWMVSGIAFVVHICQTPCPECGRRWGKERVPAHWLHQRQDGGPDRRYKDNYIVPAHCWCKCGHQFY